MVTGDLPELDILLELDEPLDETPLDLEVILDPEEGLGWGLWWTKENELLAVFTFSS